MEISSPPSPVTSPLRPCSSPAACSISSQSSLSSSSGWEKRPAEVEQGYRSYYESRSRLCWSSRRRWLGQFYLLLFLSGMMMMVGGSKDFSLQCPSGCKCTWVSGKKTADCRNSHWSTIPSGLSPEVQVLEMSDTTIKSLPKDAFRSVGLVNLQKVFLQNCKIERIDRDAFHELEIMIELDLSGNLVSTLDMETFKSNIRLRELKLSKNPLTKLTGRSFPTLKYLKLLDLSDCQLSTVPNLTFENLKELETLNLAGNRFTYISEELLVPMSKLKSLSLSGNPWKCDCRLKSLRDWVFSKNLFQHLTKCAEPPHLNFPWDQLGSAEFACRPEIVSVQIDGKPTDASLVHTDIGSDITLECLVRGNPRPDLKWVRDGQVLSNNSRAHGKSYFLHEGEEPLDGDFGISHDLRGQWVNLTIKRTDPVDAGEYTCVGSNSGGVVEKKLTLNFQDVPSGAGLGHGLGGLGGGTRESGWIWILIATIAIMVVTSILVTLVCLCSRKRRIKTTRAQDVKTDGGKLNGSVAGYIECPSIKSPKQDPAAQLQPPAQATVSKLRGGELTSNSPRFTGPGPGNSSVRSSPGSQVLCATTSSQTLTTNRNGKPVTIPCSADVELTYRINPMHLSNNSSIIDPSNINSLRRNVRCTFQRDGNMQQQQQQQSSTNYAECAAQLQQFHDMIELHPQTGIPTRLLGQSAVDPSLSQGYYHHFQPYSSSNGTELLEPSSTKIPHNQSQQLQLSGDCSQKDLGTLLPPPPQYGPSPPRPLPSCCAAMDFENACRTNLDCSGNMPSPSNCTLYSGHHHHNHNHQQVRCLASPCCGHTHTHSHAPQSITPGHDNGILQKTLPQTSTRFESDNLVVAMTRSQASPSAECHISGGGSGSGAQSSLHNQIVPVHSFCPGNYPTRRARETCCSTMGCNYPPISVVSGTGNCNPPTTTANNTSNENLALLEASAVTMTMPAHHLHQHQQNSPGSRNPCHNAPLGEIVEQNNPSHGGGAEVDKSVTSTSSPTSQVQHNTLGQNQITKETQTGGVAES